MLGISSYCLPLTANRLLLRFSLPDWHDWTTLVTLLVSAVEFLSFCLIPVVILRTRQPVAAVAWILGIILMPGLGGVLYLATGTTRVQRKTQRKQQAREALELQLPSLVAHELTPSPDDNPSVRTQLMALACRIAETRPTWGNA